MKPHSLPQVGDRIALVHTDDQWTELQPDDQGTVLGIEDAAGMTAIRIDWDSGSTLSLIVDVDEWRVVGSGP